MIIKIQKSTLFGNTFGVRDSKIYEAKKAGEPIIIEMPDGKKSKPISPEWILRTCKSFDQPSKYFTKPMKFYKVNFILIDEKEEAERSKKLLMEAMM